MSPKSSDIDEKFECDCFVCHDVRRKIKNILNVLKIYGWLTDSYIVDFFQNNSWNKLPTSWAVFLDKVTPEELGQWISNGSDKSVESKKIWPLSLICLRKVISLLEVPRNNESEITLKCRGSNQTKTLSSSQAKYLSRNSVELVPKLVTLNQFDNLFKRKVKEKKFFEINAISRVITECTRETECQTVVDLGAGVGHLARHLAFKENLDVLCIEQDLTLTKEAEKCDGKFVDFINRRLPQLQVTRPHHISLKVDFCSPDQLKSHLKAKTKYGVIGLHPCGDLATSLMRFYTTENDAKFVCLVGCCYMKLSLNKNAAKKNGYPMSNYLIRNNDHQMSYASLEVACHAVEKHCDKLRTGDFSELKVHAYRAVLECLLVDIDPKYRHSQLRSAKIKENPDFKQYSIASTITLNDAHAFVKDVDFERDDILLKLDQWKKVLIFESLRIMLAPLVESLVLYDRFIFLSEKNLLPSLKAVFDPRVSPRNIVLTSTK